MRADGRVVRGGTANAAGTRRSQEADDSEVLGEVFPVSELDPPDDESAVALELDVAFFVDAPALAPDDSVTSALRESLR